MDLRTWAGHVEDTGRRCRTCSKRLVACVGPGPFGGDGTLEFCLNCDDLTPESSWALVGHEGPPVTGLSESVMRSGEADPVDLHPDREERLECRRHPGQPPTIEEPQP